ncbi:hypothetical protein FALCPG4_001385 [Fusarium falciforme]
MADKMDRGLDEIIAETRSNRPRNQRGQGRRREPRQDYPRDGVRKSFRDESRNLDSEWVHDRYEENNGRRGPAPRRRRESPDQESRGSKLRVDNIHYDLTEDDLDELFRRIGPVVRLQLRYDRAGRSEGTAYVTYEQKEDAQEAVRQFDGANANGTRAILAIQALTFLTKAYRTTYSIDTSSQWPCKKPLRYSCHAQSPLGRAHFSPRRQGTISFTTPPVRRGRSSSQGN